MSPTDAVDSGCPTRTTVVCHDAILAAMYVAGLGVAGIAAINSGDPRNGRESGFGDAVLLILTKGRGVAPPDIRALPRRTVVMAGPDADIAVLARIAADTQALVLDGRLPGDDIVRLTAGAVRGGWPTDRAARTRRDLTLRIAEARRFDLLTPREQVVLAALATGRTPVQIARQQVVSLATVRAHVRSVYGKLDVRSLGDAVALTRRSCRLPGVLAEVGGELVGGDLLRQARGQ
ncbi:regulatory protein, luxR family [Jatrophihabitans endophyticus]|uniref:Regulatory protein, luxR family n=1 Tax=Jatrophihabitans endophyticus TaxID=1206085 RepID=A0A1M5TYE3_9ACTN|nr:LuxR C-terminal-related transcriptional regulator [Jatrophihabitans endophyticus]SHH55855.1 regulatory protein, luxR family [Jatrophihabitans endophyticus]